MLALRRLGLWSLVSIAGCGGRIAAEVGAQAVDAGAETGSPAGEVGCPAGLAGCGYADCLFDLRSDPTNCGACGVDCHEGGCDLGVCSPPPLVVLQDVGDLEALALDDANIYVSAPAAGAIYAVPKAGGAPILIADGVGPADHLVRVGAHLYAGSSTAKTIVDVDLVTRAINVIARDATISAMVADESGIYWAGQDDWRSVHAIDLHGGGRHDASKGVVFLDACSLALDAEAIYVADCSGVAGFSKVRKSDGSVQLLRGKSDYTPTRIAVAGGRVFCLESALVADGGWGPSRVVVLDTASADVLGDVIPRPAGPLSLAVDGQSAFVGGEFWGNLLWRADVGEHRWRPIAGGNDIVWAVAIDATRVFWLEAGSRRVFSLPR
jgi:hypothetical protein